MATRKCYFYEFFKLWKHCFLKCIALLRYNSRAIQLGLVKRVRILGIVVSSLSRTAISTIQVYSIFIASKRSPVTARPLHRPWQPLTSLFLDMSHRRIWHLASHSTGHFQVHQWCCLCQNLLCAAVTYCAVRRDPIVLTPSSADGRSGCLHVWLRQLEHPPLVIWRSAGQMEQVGRWQGLSSGRRAEPGRTGSVPLEGGLGGQLPAPATTAPCPWQLQNILDRKVDVCEIGGHTSTGRHRTYAMGSKNHF